MKKLIILFTLGLVLLPACRKDESEQPTDDEIIAAQARDVLFIVMNANYYWYALMPKVIKEDYKDPFELIEAMIYKPLDKWSRVLTFEEVDSWSKGKFVGHGIRLGLDDSKKARITMIFRESPLYFEGVRRGWQVKSINGEDISSILLSNDTAAYNNALGPSKEGITNRFVFQKPDGLETTISSTKSKFIYNSVLLYDTLKLTSGLTGHLVFDTFIETSVDSLKKAFKFFKQNNVKDLILDLRYNLGGYLGVADTLASFIAGNTVSPNDVFAKLEFNDKRTRDNYSFPFATLSNSLDLKRLVIITTDYTASASEAVINGLKPFLNVVTIGGSTNGKPVGFEPWFFRDKYAFWAVSFKTVNKNNEGDYFDGFEPSSLISDDVTRDFIDRNELCLQEAIHYLETGSFSGKGKSSVYRYPQFSERPDWMNNGLAIKK